MPLGLTGAALATWMLSMVNAGWYPASGMGVVIALALVCGGLMQVLAGLLEVPRGDTLGATAFVSFGAFWWSLAIFREFLSPRVPAPMFAWYLLLWVVPALSVCVASLRTNVVQVAVFVALALTLALLAGGGFGLPALTRVGGYSGLAMAALAFYAAAAGLLHATTGRAVLPVGGSAPSGPPHAPRLVTPATRRR